MRLDGRCGRQPHWRLGKAVGMLIVMWNRAHDAEAFAQDPIGELERLYVGFSQISTPSFRISPAKKWPSYRLETLRIVHCGSDLSKSRCGSLMLSMRASAFILMRYWASRHNDMLPAVVEKLVALALPTRAMGQYCEASQKIKPKMLSETVLVIQSQTVLLYATILPPFSIDMNDGPRRRSSM